MEYRIGTSKTVKERFTSNKAKKTVGKKEEDSTDQDIKDLSDELNLYDE